VITDDDMKFVEPAAHPSLPPTKNNAPSESHRGLPSQSANQGSAWRLVFPVLALTVTPFIFSSHLLDPSRLPQMAALAILTLAVGVALLLKSPKTSNTGARLDLVVLAGAACIVSGAVSLTQAVNPAEGWQDIAQAALLFAFYILIRNSVPGDAATIIRISGFVAAAMLVLCLVGIMQFFGIAFNNLPGSCEPYATLTHRNQLAIFLFLASPVAIIGSQLGRGIGRWVCAAALIVSIYVILICTTRAVWLAATVGGAAVWLASRLIKPAGETPQAAKPVARTIILASNIAVAVFLITFATGKIELRTTDSHRLMVWDKTAGMIADHPLLGVGIGNWRLVYPAYGLEKTLPEMASGELHFQRPHNDYLWIWAETGIIGLLACLTIFIAAAIYIIDILRRPQEPNSRRLAQAMLFGVAGYMVIAAVDFPREKVVPAVYLMFMLATLSSHRSTLTAIPVRAFRLSPRLAAATAIMLALIAGGVGFSRMNAEWHVRQALLARAAANWERVIAEIDLADQRYYTVDAASTPLYWYRGVANSALGRLGEAATDFQRALDVHPYHIVTLNDLASCRAKLGDDEQAIALYRRALSLSPGFAEARVNLAASLYNTGRFDEAASTLAQFDEKNQNKTVSEYKQLIERRRNEEAHPGGVPAALSDGGAR